MASAQPDLTPQAREALRLAGKGFRVFPCYGINLRSRRCDCGKAKCTSPGKHPRTDRGALDATADGSVVAAWWRQWPTANVALATGRYADGKHLLGVDVDPGHGGDETLAALEQKNGRLPESVETLTGGGGRHILLWSEEEASNSASLLGPGLDIRGNGGYLMCAPSEHQSGQQYRWEIDHAAGEHPIAPAPAWLLGLLRDRKRGGGKRAAPGEAGVSVIEGGRNLHLTSLAGAMRRRGTSEAVLLAALLAENTDRCVPPLDEAEVSVIARSVGRYAPADAWKAVPKAAPPPAGTPAPEAPGEGEALDWRDGLITTKVKRGEEFVDEPTSCLANFALILGHDERWAGKLRLNEARAQIEVLDGESWRIWQDHDDTAAAIWLQRTWKLRARPDAVCQAVQLVAQQQRCNPLADDLRALAWDGVARLDTWLEVYAGASVTEENAAYVRAVGATWLRCAIARALHPGCKADAALVLEGEQGKGKSTVFAILGGAYFTDDVPDLGQKDAALAVARAWIVELPELGAVARTMVEHVKAFLSRQVDRVRPPYGRATVELPRRCVFAGTTNRSDYLRDETGNRRFWPVRVESDANLDALRRDRDQLLAEAIHSLAAGGATVLAPELWAAAGLEQAARVEGDPWDDAVGDILDKVPTGRRVTVGEVLARLGVETERQDDRQARRVARILKRSGWIRGQKRVGGRPVWGYERPPEVSPVEPVSPVGEDKW
jgi:predicted P-loop ATPase